MCPWQKWRPGWGVEPLGPPHRHDDAFQHGVLLRSFLILCLFYMWHIYYVCMVHAFSSEYLPDYIIFINCYLSTYFYHYIQLLLFFSFFFWEVPFLYQIPQVGMRMRFRKDIDMAM